MANPCSPNNGIPETGLANILVFDAAKLAEFLLQVGMGWLSPLVPQIGGKSYNLSDFCAAYDADDAPTTDPTTIANFFNPLNPTGVADQENWLRQVVDQFVFSKSCTCDVGSFTPPTPIDQPPGVDFQPPNTTTADHCYDGTSTHTPNYASVIAWNFNDALPAGTSPYTDGEFSRPPIPQPTPSTITFTASVDSSGAHATPAIFFVNFYASGGNAITASTFQSPSVAAGGNYSSPNITVPTNAAYWQIIATKDESGSTHATNSITVNVVIYCQGQGPGTLGMVCCPTDPNLLAMIQEVLDKLNFIEAIIPVRAPTYAERATTTGLSGDGTYTVAADVIALKVVFTSTPSYVSEISGTPETFLGLGWVTPSTDSGPEAGIRVTRTTQVFPLPEACTGFDYALVPGAVISITELLAG
jgi:hypothetical protein